MDGIYNTPEVSSARETARQSSATAAQSAQSALTLPDMLRDTLTKKFEGNPLYGQRETALQDYFKTATQAPIDYTHTSAGGNSNVIFSPQEQQNLIQAARTSRLVPLTTINSLLGLQAGGLDSIIDSASRASQAQVLGLQNQAEADRQNYLDLIDLISRQADEDYRYAQLNKSSSSSSPGLMELASLLGLNMGTGASSNTDDLWKEVQGPPGPPAGYVPKTDLTGLNLSLGNNMGMGQVNAPAAKPKPQKEKLPTFLPLNQLFGY